MIAAHLPLTIARAEVFCWHVAIDESAQTGIGNGGLRASVCIRLEDADGYVGWGEVSADFLAQTADHRARLAAEIVLPLVVGRTIADVAGFFTEVETLTRGIARQSGRPGPFAAVWSGIDMALWDLAGRKAGLPLRQMLAPAGSATAVPCYASDIEPGGADATIARCQAAGFRAFKVRVGFGRERDIFGLTAARDEVGEDEGFMCDANQKWGPAEAALMAAVLRDFDLEWLEEPMRVDETAAEWQRLRAAMYMPLAGGENLRGLPVFAEAIGWLDVVQPDIGKWGGITRAVEIGRMAVAAGKRYCPAWLAGGVGQIASAHVLAAVGGDGRLEIDANPNPLRTVLVPETQAVRDGQFILPHGPGLGIAPDTGALASDRVFGAEVAG